LKLPADPVLALNDAVNITPLATTFTLSGVNVIGSKWDVMALTYLYTIWRMSFAPPGQL
jgi:hypothetical protein